MLWGRSMLYLQFGPHILILRGIGIHRDCDSLFQHVHYWSSKYVRCCRLLESYLKDILIALQSRPKSICPRETTVLCTPTNEEFCMNESRSLEATTETTPKEGKTSLLPDLYQKRPMTNIPACCCLSFLDHCSQLLRHQSLSQHNLGQKPNLFCRD